MIAAEFKRRFGSEPKITTFTPGRVNLIGEHIDYNGGLVLPTALTLGVTLALSPREDGKIFIASSAFEDMAERGIQETASDHWSDYIVGAVQLAKAKGWGPDGANIVVTTTLPFGAGISSSAAVTVGTLSGLRSLQASRLTNTDIAVLARQVENEYILSLIHI